VQVCTLLPEHCVAPGVHTPPHAPELHTYMQVAGDPHAPVDEHVSTPLLAQVVALGAQTPWQAPLTHAWLVHAAGLLHWPLD
jgi:hypothetical protein